MPLLLLLRDVVVVAPHLAPCSLVVLATSWLAHSLSVLLLGGGGVLEELGVVAGVVEHAHRRGGAVVSRRTSVLKKKDTLDKFL